MTDPGRLARQPEPRNEAGAGDPQGAPERGRRARWLQAGQLLGGLVHELKNPLAVVQGYGQLLLERCADGSEDREDLESLLAEVARVVRLVDELQLYVRPGQEPLAQLDVAESLESAVTLVRHRLREARVRVEIELPHGVPSVWATRTGLLHGLVTLLRVATDELAGAPGDSHRVRVEGRQAERGFALVFSWTASADALPAHAVSDLELCADLLERGGGCVRAAALATPGEPRRALVELLTGADAVLDDVP